MSGNVMSRRKSRSTRSKTLRSKRLLYESLEPRLVLDSGPLFISEFMAVNDSTLADEDGDFSDWVEIHNRSEMPVVLDGWYLTDNADNLTKWEFPDHLPGPEITLGPDDYFIVFASNKDRRVVGSPLHTNFVLDAGGEYLALVRPDGQTVADELAAEYPQQFSDISYGTTEFAGSFSAADGIEQTYRVPTASDALLGTSWAMPGFDDSAWMGSGIRPSRVLITEASTGQYDGAEVQNVSDGPVDTSGWVVVANNAIDLPPQINQWHTTFWNLPPRMTAGEVLYETDEPGEENYWGENIFWRTNGAGWVMLLDDQGHVADFVVWGYSPTEIASLDVTIGEHRVTGADVWNGAAVPADGLSDNSLQRHGGSDHDNASDWAFASPPSLGTANQGLETPFVIDLSNGLGFDVNGSPLADAIRIDVGSVMQHVNASLWTRIPIEMNLPAGVAAMRLRVKYNDGFVAYLNGQEVARRNAPETLDWNASATAARSVDDSLVYEEIDVSRFLDAVHVGTNLLAFHALNVDAADGDFLILPELAGEAWLYSTDPTPGNDNAEEGFTDYVRDTSFSVDRGFYEDPFDLVISTNTPNAAIYYTTDGSLPSETNGTRYTGPIRVSTTTTLRAVASKNGFLPTNVDTQTYLFLEDVIRQPTDPAGFPTSWGPARVDYEMDQTVVDPNLATIIDDLKSLPTLSLVTDLDHWFDASTGIFANTWGYGEDWERPLSVEYFDPNEPTREFQIDAGVRIQGASSRNHFNAKHNLRLYFAPEYDGDLKFQLFPDSTVDHFERVTLLAGGHDGPMGHPTHEGPSTFCRDRFLHKSALDMGLAAPTADAMHVYLNGMYWGMYWTTERPDHAFAADYFGGSEDDYDAIKHKTWNDNNYEVIHGSATAWNQMFSLARAGLSSQASYEAIQQYLDVESFADYLIVNMHSGNDDWPKKNWYATRKREPGAGFQFYTWDGDFTLGLINTTTDRTGVNNTNTPGELYSRLRANAEFRMLFADRIQKHLFNDGAMTVEAMQDRFRAITDQVEQAIVPQSARWSDDPWYEPDGDPANDFVYTREGIWQPEVDRILNYVIPLRYSTSLEDFRNAGLYPSLDAPAYNQHGGQVPENFELTISAPAGTIYYTLDGSDPRMVGGAVSLDALIFTGNPVTLSESTLVKARARSGGQWSALCEAQFFVERPASVENLAISEINYNPYPPTAEERAAGFTDNDDFEFIELRNVSLNPVVLTGAVLVDGVDFEFDAGAVRALSSGESVVVVQNAAAFAARYGAAANVAGQYEGRLKNEGERIRLADFFGNPIADFSYGDGTSWPGRADGKGASLELIAPDLVPVTEPERGAFLSDGAHWRSSSEYGGSPGLEGTGPIDNVVINEVLARTPAIATLDQIELHNTTAEPIDVGGWYLSDDWGWDPTGVEGNYRRFRVPEGTIIPALGYVVFDEEDFNPGGGTLPTDFALNGPEGDDVWLMEADATGKLTRFADHVEFGDTAVEEAWGRWPNDAGGFHFYPMIHATLDKAHPENGQNSGPRLGSVILSEVNYHPLVGQPDDDLEFVEIYNPTGQAVDLEGWQLGGGIDFDFPAGTTLPPHQTLVVVPFDLGEVDKLTAFNTYYGLTEPILMVGGYADQLSNGDDRVRLLRPGDPPPDSPEMVPLLLEDELTYRDQSPWPTEADGTGASLHRRSAGVWGNTHLNWDALPPDPGEVVIPAEVVGRHVFYNGSAFDGNDPAPNAQDDDAIALDMQALLPGQTASFSNYTSYSRGINGLMVDVAALAGTPTMDDFRFKVGNDDNPAGWTAVTAMPSITLRQDAGVDGSDRVTIIWPDNTIQKQWLQLTVLATANTGLAEDDVFYFGNAIGESGNSSIDAKVNAIDMLAARNNQRTFINPAPIDFDYDYDRDARVNATDLLIARNNQTNFITALKLITVPPIKASGAEESMLLKSLSGEPSLPAIRLDRAEGENLALVEKVSAHDTVWEGNMGKESGNRQISPAKLDWLYDFELMGTNRQPTKKEKTAEDTLDQVLVGDWQ